MKPTLRPTILGTSIPATIRHLAWLAPLVCACNASALTWNVGGPTDNWSTGGADTNWTGGVTWTNGNTQAAFGGTAGENITVSTVTTNEILFNNTGTAYNLSGGTITINSGVATNKSINATADATISSNILINGAQTYSVSSGKTLNLGNINAVAAGTNVGLQGGSIIINGSIGSNVGQVLFNGGSGVNGTATFTTANTFTGVLHLGVSGGSTVLNFSNVNQLGAGTGSTYIAIQNGSTLKYTGTGSQTTAARDLFWNIGAATIDITSATANLTFDITGGGRGEAFTKAGAGQLTLKKSTAINELTSNAVLITGGILEYNQNNAGAISRFGGTVTGSAGTQIKVSGTGFIGNDNLTANWSANLAGLDVGSGAAFDLRGNKVTVDALTGGGTVRNSFVVAAESGLQGNTLTVGANGGGGTFSGILRGSLANTGDHGSDSGGANGILNLTKIGTGTQILSGANTYSGTTTVGVNGGTLQFAKTTSFYSTSFAGGAIAQATVQKLIVNSGGTAAFNVGGGTSDFDATQIGSLISTANSTGGKGFLAGSKLGLDTTNATGGTFTYGNVIANTGNGSLGLTKLGTGTLVLDQTNTYTGATTVSAGTLSITGNSSAATGAVTVSGGSLYVSGQLGGNVTVTNGATIGGNGTIGTLALNGTSNLDLTNLSAAVDLTTSGISFASAGFGVDNLLLNGAAIDWSTVLDGTYTLLNGTLNSANLDNFGAANAYDIDGGSGSRTAYFQSGSLQLVVVPEPTAAALLGSFGMLTLLRRRRA